MKSLYVLLLAVAVSAVSCRTKQGEPGPAGKTNLMQQGSISGTISYTNTDGNDTEALFRYTYFESLDDNKFYFDDSDGDYYELSFARRDLKDYNNTFSFDVYGYGTNGIEDAPESGYMNFSFTTVINGELVEFNSYGGTITNVNLDPTTGRLTFNYTNSSMRYGNGDATLTATVDVILNRSADYVLNLE